MLGQTPSLPHDPDAELIILGNCILTESREPLGELGPQHFYSTLHSKVAQAIIALAESGRPINTLELHRHFEEHKNGITASDIAALTDGVPLLTPQTTPHYRERLTGKLQERSVLWEANALSRAAESGESAVQIVERAEQLAAHAKDSVRSSEGAGGPASKKRKLVYPEIPRAAWTSTVALYVDAVSESTEASDCYHYASFYTAVGSLLGRTVYVRKGRVTYPNLYTVLVGRSGARKGTAMGLALDFLRDIDENDYITETLDSREGFVVDLSEAQRMFGDRGQHGTFRCVLALEEFRSLIEKAEQKGTKNITPFLCFLYDCPQTARNKSKNNPAEVKLPTLAILAGTSPSYLENLSLADIEGGFGNRLCWIPGDPKPRKDDPPDPDTSVLAVLKGKVRDAIEESRERDTTRFKMSGAAAKRFKKFYLEEYSPACGDEVIKVLSERDDQTCLKYATINATLDHSPGIIEEHHLEPAIAFVSWLWEARFPVFAGHGLSPAAQTDVKIVEKVKDAGAGGISYRNLQKALHRIDAESFHRRMNSLTAPDSALRIGHFGKKRWVFLSD